MTNDFIALKDLHDHTSLLQNSEQFLQRIQCDSCELTFLDKKTLVNHVIAWIDDFAKKHEGVVVPLKTQDKETSDG